MSARPDMVRELKSLRKGRGVVTHRIADRVGPALRTICGITEGDRPVAVRKKLTVRLAELAEQLPEDLHMVTLAAFAITVDARLPLYQDRVHWLAIRMNRDPRTVRRRVDEAIAELADLAAGATDPRPDDPADGWHTTELRVALALDQPEPEVLEQHRIIADRDGLRELELATLLPVGRPDTDVRVYYGGTLAGCGPQPGGRPGVTLTLPGPVFRGESHDFAVRLRLPTARALRPYLVCVPNRPCSLFDLRVRFGRDNVPPHVWTLPGTSQPGTSQPGATAAPRHPHQHPVDQAGEIHLRFHQLTPGLAYGVRWDPP